MLDPTRALVLTLILVPSACNAPPSTTGTTTPPVTSPTASAASSPQPPSSASAAAPAAPGKPGACSSDADCRTWSSYCAEAPCACRVLGKNDPDPRCAGPSASNVRCFADPCMKKSARCEGLVTHEAHAPEGRAAGACVLSPGATDK